MVINEKKNRVGRGIDKIYVDRVCFENARDILDAFIRSRMT